MGVPDPFLSQSGNSDKAVNPFLAFLVALQFLTISPPFIRRAFTSKELGASTAFFPAVGLLFGVLLWFGNLGLDQFSPSLVSAALTLLFWVLLSGALHLDGFLDTCDGLFGGQDPQERLAIMKDERVGAFALAGGVLLLLSKYAALASLHFSRPALLLAPTLGRWGMVCAIWAFPYARPSGLGRALKDYTGWRQVVFASAFAFGVAWLTAGLLGLFACLFSALAVFLLAGFTLKRIPGLTGDIYGALNELIELFVLLIFTFK
jgi:adenosylcobinamide-GDP ribazoletransferase